MAEMDPPDPPAHTPRCAHRIAPGTEWPWLPTHTRGHLARHPWCTQCGSIAAVGGERARDLGGLVNEIARICAALAVGGIKVTEAQRRLMTRRLAALDAHDRFAFDRDTQERTLLGVVSEFTGLAPDTIATYARAV